MKNQKNDKNRAAVESAMLQDESPTPAPHRLVRLQERQAFADDRAMLLDESPTPARHALIRLQERPVFQMDDRKRAFAMIGDLDDGSEKIQADEGPSELRESKPKQ